MFFSSLTNLVVEYHRGTLGSYMVTRSAAPPLPPPPWSMVQDAPPPVGWSVGSLFPLWGGCGGFGVLGLA